MLADRLARFEKVCGFLFLAAPVDHLIGQLSLSKIGNLLLHPFPDGHIGNPFTELSSVDSTNNYAMGRVHAGLANHGQVIFAHEQFAGKGQRNKSWLSKPDENIIMSCIIKPNYPSNRFPFLLSATVTLSCIDLLNQVAPNDYFVKWPNDIYWCDRKAGGILIDNNYKGTTWNFAIAGIGLNINQVEFEKDIPNPVSLKQITGKNYDVVELAKELCKLVDDRFTILWHNSDEAVISEYNSLLYKRNEKVKFRKGNIVFEGTVGSVDLDGRLTISDFSEQVFGSGEIEWVMKPPQSVF